MKDEKDCPPIGIVGQLDEDGNITYAPIYESNLLGDKIHRAVKRIPIRRLRSLAQRCKGCGERREKLNELDRKVRRVVDGIRSKKRRSGDGGSEEEDVHPFSDTSSVLPGKEREQSGEAGQEDDGRVRDDDGGLLPP